MYLPWTTHFFDILPGGVGDRLPDRRSHPDIPGIAAVNGHDLDQHPVADIIIVVAVVHPLPGNIPGIDRRFDAEHLDADDPFADRDDTGLGGGAFLYQRLSVAAGRQEEMPLLTEHGIPAAGHHRP